MRVWSFNSNSKGIITDSGDYKKRLYVQIKEYWCVETQLNDLKQLIAV